MQSDRPSSSTHSVSSGTLLNLSEMSFLIRKKSSSYHTWCHGEHLSVCVVLRKHSFPQRPTARCVIPALPPAPRREARSAVCQRLSSPPLPSGWSEAPGRPKAAWGKFDCEDPKCLVTPCATGRHRHCRAIAASGRLWNVSAEGSGSIRTNCHSPGKFWSRSVLPFFSLY